MAETLNGLLNAEADALCGAGRYERSPDRVDSQAGSYKRGLSAVRLIVSDKCLGLVENIFKDVPRQKIRTNNPLERIMKETRRRTRVVGSFPDGQSALMLVAARLRHIAGTKWGTRRYLSMERLYELEQGRKVA